MTEVWMGFSAPQWSLAWLPARQTEEITKYLVNGWEPFAATADRDGHIIYHLRRRSFPEGKPAK